LSDAICFNACTIASEVGAKAINGMTYSGYTAFMLASNRPKADIHIFTSNKNLLNTLGMVWGVDVFYYNKFVSTDQSIEDIIEILKSNGLVETNDIIVSTASMPITGRGRTNMVKINQIK
jgi:pyruvate kinase